MFTPIPTKIFVIIVFVLIYFIIAFYFTILMEEKGFSMPPLKRALLIIFLIPFTILYILKKIR